MRPARFDRTFLVAVAACSGAIGCVNPPAVPLPKGDLATPPPMNTFADTVLTYSVNGVPSTSCMSSVPPNCTTTTIETGSCPAIGVLGPNSDGKSGITLHGGDTLIVGGADMATIPTADFRIYGTTSGTVLPVVEVSENATDYYPVNVWNTFLNPNNKPQTTPYVDFDLNYTSKTGPALQVARYVSITQNGGGTVVITAIESLRAKQ